MQDEQRRTIQQTLQHHPIQQAYLFGSHVRGTENKLSDVDIAVLYKPSIDKDAVESKLFAELSHQLQTDRIDIVDIEAAPPLLAHRSVIRGIPLLHHSAHDEAILKTRILHAYEDTRHLREIKQKTFT